MAVNASAPDCCACLRALRFARAFFLLLACGCAAAQPYPSRPIHLVVPFSPGGGVDISARIVGQKLAEALGVSAVIDNRPGAGTIIGTQLVAKATPDGYTLVMVSSAHAINPGLYRKLPYDSVKDFAPVTVVIFAPGMLVAGPGIRARNVKEFIALARSKPGQMTYSSAGNGSSGHLAMELLKSMSSIDLIHVPYKGGGDLIGDLVGGRIDVSIPSIAAALPLVKAGKLTALAVTSMARTTATPEVPTMAEAGVPGYEAASWYALLAPAGTPRVIVDRLSAETVRVLRRQDVRERLLAEGLEPAGSTPHELAARIKEEIVKWQHVIHSAGIKIE